MLKNESILVQNTTSDKQYFMAINPAAEQKSIIIVNGTLTIIFANIIAQRDFGIRENSTVYSIKTDPEFYRLLKNFIVDEKYLNLNLLINIETADDNEIKEYITEIEKVRIDQSHLLLISFALKRNKQLLEGNINSLHSAIDYADLPIMILNKFGNISFITRAMEKIIGIGIEELYGKSFCQSLKSILSENDLFEAEQAIIDSHPWVKVMTLRANNKILYKELQLKPFINSILNENLYVFIANDISDYINKNLIIKQSENKLKAIINNISDPLIILKVKGSKILFESANNIFFKVFDFQNDNLIDKDVRLLFINGFLKLIINSIDSLLNNDLDYTEFNSDYSDTHYSCKISKMDISNEKDVFLLVSLNDITVHQKIKIKMTEAYKKVQQLNELKTAFLSNMSHEIRTPLNALSGYSELFEESLKANDFSTIVELTTLVKEVLLRVSILFDQIIDMSEIESGELLFDYVYLDARKVLISVFNKLYSKAEKKNIKLELELSEFVPLIKIDWNKLEKVVYAVVENAIKFTNEGKVILKLFEFRQEVHIVIIDTGEGMDNEDIKHLIEPFSKAELGYTRQYEGMGLGLAIASRLTKLMGGRFEILSNKGMGTKVNLIFTVT